MDRYMLMAIYNLCILMRCFFCLSATELTMIKYHTVGSVGDLEEVTVLQRLRSTVVVDRS